MFRKNLLGKKWRWLPENERKRGCSLAKKYGRMTRQTHRKMSRREGRFYTQTMFGNFATLKSQEKEGPWNWGTSLYRQKGKDSKKKKGAGVLP